MALVVFHPTCFWREKLRSVSSSRCILSLRLRRVFFSQFPRETTKLYELTHHKLQRVDLWKTEQFAWDLKREVFHLVYRDSVISLFPRGVFGALQHACWWPMVNKKIMQIRRWYIVSKTLEFESNFSNQLPIQLTGKYNMRRRMEKNIDTIDSDNIEALIWKEEPRSVSLQRRQIQAE